MAPTPVSYTVGTNEVASDAKQLAGTIALALTTYPTGTSAGTIAASITDDAEARSELEVAAEGLVDTARWSRGEILYPQLGGLTQTAASVMVVVRQEMGTDDTTETAHTRTLDIRLELIDGAWSFAGLASSGGTPLARPADLSAAATSVLDDPRILLPDSARWDIYRGHTSTALLQLMSDLAEVTPYAVTVLGTGHPHHVFDTERTSNHTVGRAVDVFLLGSDLVIDDRTEGSLTHTTLQWLYDRDDVYKVGGPWALDGPGGRSFTNLVHQDHLHISVSR
jgi:hypothetical protein